MQWYKQQAYSGKSQILYLCKGKNLYLTLT